MPGNGKLHSMSTLPVGVLHLRSSPCKALHELWRSDIAKEWQTDKVLGLDVLGHAKGRSLVERQRDDTLVAARLADTSELREEEPESDMSEDKQVVLQAFGVDVADEKVDCFVAEPQERSARAVVEKVDLVSCLAEVKSDAEGSVRRC